MRSYVVERVCFGLRTQYLCQESRATRFDTRHLLVTGAACKHVSKIKRPPEEKPHGQRPGQALPRRVPACLPARRLSPERGESASPTGAGSREGVCAQGRVHNCQGRPEARGRLRPWVDRWIPGACPESGSGRKKAASSTNQPRGIMSNVEAHGPPPLLESKLAIIDFGMLRNAPCFANTALRCGDVKKKQAHRAERKGPLFQAGKVWPTSEAAECPSGL